MYNLEEGKYFHHGNIMVDVEINIIIIIQMILIYL